MKKIFFLLLLTLFYSCSKDDVFDSPIIENTSIVRPPYLVEGDEVGIVAISSKITLSREESEQFIDKVRSWGLRVRLGNHLFDQSGGWFPASDTERASDLQSMINDPAIKAVIFFRGGYGAVRALNYVDLLPLRKSPKWLVGYSDLTAVHAALRNIRVESIHGTMPGSFVADSDGIDYSALSLRSALWGELTEYQVAPHPLNNNGQTRGVLVGGNLTLIESINGTGLDFDLNKPSILLIEDVGENIYRIDRMLQTLQNAGKFKSVKGIIIGHFTDIEDEERWGKTVFELIKEYTIGLDIPVLFGFPAGHEQPNYSLYMGREVELTVNDAGGKLGF